MTPDRATEAPLVVSDADNNNVIAAPLLRSNPPAQTARDLAATKTSLAASLFAAASRFHLSAATQDLLLATRVNSSIASAASAASSELAGWGDLRDALSEKLAALGTLSADAVEAALGPRVNALEQEAEELDALSKTLAREVGCEEDEDEEEEDDDDSSGSESEPERGKKTPKKKKATSSSSATAAASAAASAAATAASAAASKLWNRWAPGGDSKR